MPTPNLFEAAAKRLYPAGLVVVCAVFFALRLLLWMCGVPVDERVEQICGMLIAGAVVFTYSYHPRFGCMGPKGKAALRPVLRRDVYVAWTWAVAIDLFFGFFAAIYLYLVLADNRIVPRLNQLIPWL